MHRKPVTPLLTVDCVAIDAKGRVLLIKRGNPPFQGHYALPGGFVDVGETVEDACRVKGAAKAGDDAASVEWVESWRRLDLAFDHKQILKDAAKLL